jgi:hypothetical protein
VQQGSLQRIAQLADVAGPGASSQFGDRGVGDGGLKREISDKTTNDLREMEAARS